MSEPLGRLLDAVMALEMAWGSGIVCDHDRYYWCLGCDGEQECQPVDGCPEHGTHGHYCLTPPTLPARGGLHVGRDGDGGGRITGPASGGGAPCLTPHRTRSPGRR